MVMDWFTFLLWMLSSENHLGIWALAKLKSSFTMEFSSMLAVIIELI